MEKEKKQLIASLEDLIKKNESAVEQQLAAKESMSDELAKMLKMDEVIESSKEVIESSKELLRKLIKK